MLTGLLPDYAIRKLALEDGMITPYHYGDKEHGKISAGQSSYGYDIRLGNHFKVFSNGIKSHGQIMDPKNYPKDAYDEVETDTFITIQPGCFALGESLETFSIPRDIMCFVLGKSSYARCGTHYNVTPLEPGWRGKITIEISNDAPLPCKVYAGEGAAQILFFRGAAPCDRDYNSRSGRYQDQYGIALPKV